MRLKPASPRSQVKRFKQTDAKYLCTAIVQQRILGECLLISSLPGKALRMLVDIARLAERFNKHSQS